MSENPTRVTINDLLTAADMPAGTSVHFGHVTDSTLAPPFCIFHVEPGIGGNEEWSMGGGGIDTEIWVVKGAGPRLVACEEIDEAAQAVLDNTDALEFCRRLGPISYSEVNAGKTTWYRGSRYRVRKDKG